MGEKDNQAIIDAKSGDTEKFVLQPLDKYQLVSAVNEISHRLNEKESKESDVKNSPELQAAKNMDTQEGRKKFLKDKWGIDENTPGNFRVFAFHDENGGVPRDILFKGKVVDGMKVVLTESMPLPDGSSKDDFARKLLTPSFKALPQPIEVQVEKETINVEGNRSLEISPAEQQKLSYKATFAALLHKADNIEVDVASNAALPRKQRTGPNLMV